MREKYFFYRSLRFGLTKFGDSFYFCFAKIKILSGRSLLKFRINKFNQNELLFAQSAQTNYIFLRWFEAIPSFNITFSKSIFSTHVTISKRIIVSCSNFCVNQDTYFRDSFCFTSFVLFSRKNRAVAEEITVHFE